MHILCIQAKLEEITIAAQQYVVTAYITYLIDLKYRCYGVVNFVKICSNL